MFRLRLNLLQKMSRLSKRKWTKVSVHNLNHITNYQPNNGYLSIEHYKNCVGKTNNVIFFQHVNEFGQESSSAWDPLLTNNIITQHAFNLKLHNTHHAAMVNTKYIDDNFEDGELRFTHPYFLEKIEKHLSSGGFESLEQNKKLANTTQVSI